MKAYTIKCAKQKCLVHVVLPHQILPEKFGGQLNQATDIWPINFLCHQCGRLSVVQAKSIRLKEIETLDHSLLIRYDFSSAQADFLLRCTIYTKEQKDGIASQAIARQAADVTIAHVLRPSGLWKDSYEQIIWVSIDAGCTNKPTVALKSISKIPVTH